jgi:hypothetical protein
LRREIARFLLHTSACFFFSRTCMALIWSTVLPPETMTASSSLKYTIMHINASQVECSTFKMHQAENVLECVKMRHV